MQTITNILESTDARKNLKQTRNIKHVICHRGSNIAFVLTDDKTIVITSSGAFLMEPMVVRGDLWRRRLMKIRRLILERKISDYDSLIGFCRPGITMIWVKLEWYV